MIQQKLENQIEQLDRRAGSQPRDMWDANSPEYCWATATHLAFLWQIKERTASDIERELRKLEESRAWEKIPPGQPYGSLDALLKAHIGVGEVETKSTLAELVERVPALSNHGTNQHRESDGCKGGVDIINSSVGGTSREYRIARLKRDAPEIAAALARGEYPSVAAAYRAAGLEKQPDPVARIVRQVERLGPEGRARLAEALKPLLEEARRG